MRAYYLKIWLEDEVAHLNQCPWEEDLEYAQRVCAQLDVPLETLSLQREYWDRVVQHTLREVRLGRTPNPDILCNSQIKFGTFYEYVQRRHDRVATGHYATTSPLPRLPDLARSLGRDPSSAHLQQTVVLGRAPDPVKDQSYFLSHLSQSQLRRCVFPIGGMRKSEVRHLAQHFDLPTANRKDSQGICFLGKLKFDDFLRHYCGESEGEVRCINSNRVLGRHRGLWFHTLGQRRGIGPVLHPKEVHAGPWFVAKKDVASNTLFVSNDWDSVEAPRRRFTVGDVHWSVAPPLALATEGVAEVEVRVRHGPGLQRAEVRVDRVTGSLRVNLREKDKGIAPGQTAAFYLKEYCIGAGVIDEVDSD